LKDDHLKRRRDGATTQVKKEGQWMAW